MNIYISIYPSLHLPIYLSTVRPIYLSTDRPIYLSIHPSIYPSIDLSVYLSISLSLSIYLSSQLSIHLSIYPSIYLSICLIICHVAEYGNIAGNSKYRWNSYRTLRNTDCLNFIILINGYPYFFNTEYSNMDIRRLISINIDYTWISIDQRDTSIWLFNSLPWKITMFNR